MNARPAGFFLGGELHIFWEAQGFASDEHSVRKGPEGLAMPVMSFDECSMYYLAIARFVPSVAVAFLGVAALFKVRLVEWIVVVAGSSRIAGKQPVATKRMVSHAERVFASMAFPCPVDILGHQAQRDCLECRQGARLCLGDAYLAFTYDLCGRLKAVVFDNQKAVQNCSFLARRMSQYLAL